MENDKKTGCADSKRLFIAITLPAALRTQLFESIRALGRQDAAIKPISPECIHLTLKFLGSTDILMLREVIDAIFDTVKDIGSFVFTSGNRIAAFPDIPSARILFVPVSDNTGQIAEVFKVLEANLAKIKIKNEERKFIPHITVARIKENLSIGTVDLLKKTYFNFTGTISCSKITLFESRLKPSGPDYIILEEFALK